MELKRTSADFNEADFSDEEIDDQNGSQGPLREEGNQVDDKDDFGGMGDDACNCAYSTHTLVCIVFITNYLA